MGGVFGPVNKQETPKLLKEPETELCHVLRSERNANWQLSLVRLGTYEHIKKTISTIINAAEGT